MFVLQISFFFSSRRRHTRFDCDWSSDVCSSDLSYHQIAMAGRSQHRSQDQGQLERAGPNLARLTFVEWRDRGGGWERGGWGKRGRVGGWRIIIKKKK